MLKALLRVKDHAEDSIIDWHLVENLIECLSDVALLTTKMQKEVYPMGTFFADLKICEFDLASRKGQLDPDDPTSERQVTVDILIDNMLTLLEKRTTPLLSTPTFAAAIICDPRLNTENTFAITEAQREEGIVSI